jgi:hypothetical protein
MRGRGGGAVLGGALMDIGALRLFPERETAAAQNGYREK